jgi:hypothetical protein
VASRTGHGDVPARVARYARGTGGVRGGWWHGPHTSASPFGPGGPSQRTQPGPGQSAAPFTCRETPGELDDAQRWAVKSKGQAAWCRSRYLHPFRELSPGAARATCGWMRLVLPVEVVQRQFASPQASRSLRLLTTHYWLPRKRPTRVTPGSASHGRQWSRPARAGEIGTTAGCVGYATHGSIGATGGGSSSTLNV